MIPTDEQLNDFEFIKNNIDEIDWKYISQSKNLSESFIRKFKDKLDLYFLSQYQTLSEEFIKEFNLKISDDNWMYKSNEFKLDYIKNNTNYKVIDDQYILAYKSTLKNGQSVYKPNFYQYKVGKSYESHCDCNSNIDNSFGLSAWTKEGALGYHSSGDLYLVKINIEDIGCITKLGNKIRAKKITIVEKIK